MAPGRHGGHIGRTPLAATARATTLPTADEDLVMPGKKDVGRKSALTVVGVGASAGGLQALKTLLGTVPRDSGLSFVIVVHLPTNHDSHLAELLQPHCA